jgi:hypothetical protein
MNPREVVTNIINDPIKATGNSSAFLKPKNSTVIVRSISLFGVLSSALLSFIPGKIGIREMFAPAYAQLQRAISDPLSDSMQIVQSKVQAATSPGAFGHGFPSLYSISIQDLLMILGICSHDECDFNTINIHDSQSPIDYLFFLFAMLQQQKLIDKLNKKLENIEIATKNRTLSDFM